ncbi:MAG: hypothetical protein QM497_08505 [Sulfurimonas sp.]
MLKTTVFITSLILSTHLFADNGEAKVLFDEAKCMKCHDYNSFSYKKDKINSFKKLHTQVQRCESGNHVGWFEEEILDVTNYLNDDFYHFKVESSK